MNLLNWLFKFLLSMTVALVQIPSMGQTDNLFLICETTQTTIKKYSVEWKPIVKSNSKSAMLDISSGAIVEGTIFGGLHTKNGFYSQANATNFYGSIKQLHEQNRVYKPHEILYTFGTYSLDRITGVFSASILYDELDQNGKIKINGSYEIEEKGKCLKAEKRLY